MCTVVAQRNGTLPSGTEALNLGLKLAKTATEGKETYIKSWKSQCCAAHADFDSFFFVSGKLPSDELVGEVLSFLQPKGLADGKAPPQISIPEEARQAFEAFSGPSTSTLMSAGLLPLMSNGLEILDQVPLLIEEVCQWKLIRQKYSDIMSISHLIAFDFIGCCWRQGFCSATRVC